MLRREVYKVAGLIGGGLTSLTGLGIIIFYIVDLFDNRSSFSALLFLFTAVPLYVVPAALALAFSVPSTENRSSLLGWSATSHTLAGLGFATLGVLLLRPELNPGSVFPIKFSLIFTDPQLAFMVFNSLGALSLLISGILRWITYFTDNSRTTPGISLKPLVFVLLGVGLVWLRMA